MKVQPRKLTPLAYKQITGLSTVKTLADTTPIPPTATYAIVQAESQDVRWTADGSAPTAGLGMTLLAGYGAELHWEGDLSVLKFIQASASAKLNVQFFKDADK